MEQLFQAPSPHARAPVNIDDLADIQDVVIDPSLPQEERERSYLTQIRNPYLYRCGDIICRVSFANTEYTLEDRLKQYLMAGRGLLKLLNH
jgi:hypothetical protein